MKDRKRIYDKRNIDKLENEVKRFIEQNHSRFEKEKAEEEQKRKRSESKKRKKKSKSKSKDRASSKISTQLDGEESTVIANPDDSEMTVARELSIQYEEEDTA